MNRFSLLDQMVDAGNGYLQTSQVLSAGITKPTLAEYVKKRNMEHVAHGVYRSEDAWPDDLYVLALTNSRIVFSHETALLLHGLMEREPLKNSVTVIAGYNATHLRNKGLRVFQVKPELYPLGIVEVQTHFGNVVRTYDMERSVCDLIRNKTQTDIQIFQYALKEYMASSKKNLNRLALYAKAFQIEPIVRTYTEVML